MTNLELGTLLQAIITMEDKMPEGVLWKLDYEAFVHLAQTVEAPSFITEYFARKALTATNPN